MEVIFISGIHGAGKGFLCQKIKNELAVDTYSCSELIKKYSDYVEDGKAVTDAEKNQIALVEALKELDGEKVLLDGHFCLLGKDGKVIELDFSTFEAIKPDKVILVTCNEEVIAKRLAGRDGKSIEVDLLKELQQTEIKRAKQFCDESKIPMKTYISESSEEKYLLQWLDV